MVPVRQRKSDAAYAASKYTIIHSSSLLGMTQLMAGGGIVIIAQTVIPQLSTLF